MKLNECMEVWLSNLREFTYERSACIEEPVCIVHMSVWPTHLLIIESPYT